MLLQNIKASLKRLSNNKLYTAINLGGLSLSFAIAILILLYVYNEFNVDKYHKNLNSLYRLTEKKDNHSYTAAKFGDYIINKYPEVKYFSRYIHFELASQYANNKSIKIENVAFLDSSCIDMFSINILKSNTNKLLRTNQSIIISKSIAQKLFGENDPLGQSLKLENTVDYIVEGVFEDSPSNSCFKHDVIVNFTSIKFFWGFPEYNVLEEEGNWSFTTFLMLNENVNKEEFDERIQKDLVERFERPTEFYLQEFSDIYFNNAINDDGVRHGKKQIVYLFLTIALIIIIIAMINYINLSTSISAQQALRIGIHKTFGAHRGNLIIQFMVETTIICIMALIFGYILAELFIPAFNNYLQNNLLVKTFYAYPFNIISIVSAITIGIISGLYPALYLTKLSPIEILKGKVSKAKGLGIFKKVLMVFQFIITITLITGTITVYKQLSYWRNMDIGIKKDHILTLNASPDLSKSIKVFQERIERITNVENTCISDGTVGYDLGGLYTIIDDQEITMRHLYVDSKYFDLYNIEVIDGEGFSKNNLKINKRKYLLNEAAVKYLNWENPYEKDIWGWKCIGIVKDFIYESQHEKIRPLFISFDDEGSTVSIMLSSTEIPNTIYQIKKIWTEMSPEFPFEYKFIDDIFDSHYKNEERLTKLLSYFAVFSIFIACLGLFGLISFMAEQRTKEIGIRKANGANIGDIISLFSKEFIQLVLISGIIAIPISFYLLSIWLQNFAYATKLSWWVFAISIIIAIIISSLSVLYRTYKAALQNPVEILKHE